MDPFQKLIGQHWQLPLLGYDAWDGIQILAER